MSGESFVTLVEPQRRTLWLCALALVAVGACATWPAALAPLFHSSSTTLKLAAWLAGLVVLAGACRMVRCRACGLSLVWHAMSTRPAGDWLAWLLDVRTCPRCALEERADR